MPVPTIISLARLCRLVSVAAALAWLLNSLVCVVPASEEAHHGISVALACGFMVFVSSSAILYGVAKGCKPKTKDSETKRVVSRLLFVALIFAGSFLLGTGHALYIEAKVRKPAQSEIVLNIAGPRESELPGIKAATLSFVKHVLSEPSVSNAPHVKTTRDETEEAST